MPVVAAALAALLLAGCAAPSAPAEPSGEAPAPTATSAAPAPQPTETADPRAGWRTIETQDGLFRWQIPADWTVVDESFEAEDDLGWVNQLTVVSELGQDLAFFGSASYGDRGGICASPDDPGLVDAEGFVPALVHDDELVELGEGLLGMDLEPVEGARLVAHTRTSDDESFVFYAGFTMYPMREDAVPCLQYSDVAVPDGYPQTSFGTTHAPALWQVESYEQGEAYTETEEYSELMDMFRSLELTGAHR
ncbi:hypothetical protein GCM10010968_04260 [Agrococcus terreus]|uniref:Lipoprotein n=2 Tax=Agrococcus terreus TaxID=574649 RepID=A0ABQ2KBE5_9MICO|nr:hypothetical protein GCM10010968_04260 [Agrococcus terreus]